MTRIHTSHTLEHHLKPAAQIEINEGKNHRSQRGQRQHNRPKARSDVLPHNLSDTTIPRHKKPSATQCPLFGCDAFEEHLYLQQVTAAVGRVIPHQPVSGGTNTTF